MKHFSISNSSAMPWELLQMGSFGHFSFLATGVPFEISNFKCEIPATPTLDVGPWTFDFGRLSASVPFCSQIRADSRKSLFGVGNLLLNKLNLFLVSP
jgi:hypothetical protein